MVAVVDILGQQLKVAEKEKYYVPSLNKEEGSEVSFDKVLVLADDKGSKIGSPYVEGAKVTAKVLANVKDDKILVFKKKRRISYRKTRGHKQHLTRIEITKIG